MGMCFDEGRGATSPLTPTLPSSSPLRNPSPAGETTKSNLCFLTSVDIANRWCLGFVNGTTGTRFCMREKRPGSTHCGIKKHGGRASRAKFQPQEDCFYILAGTTNGQPVAKKEPFLHWEDVPAHKRGLLKNNQKTTREWTAVFEDIITEKELKESELGDVLASHGVQPPYQEPYFRVAREDIFQDVDPESEEDDPLEGGLRRVPREVEFSWDTDDEQPPRGTPSPAHRAALELLRMAHEDQVDVSRLQGRTLREIRTLLDDQSSNFHAFQRKMGRIDALANQHGSVAEAIDKAIAEGEPADLTVIIDKINQFWQDLDEAVAETESSKTMLLQLMMKVHENSAR